MYKLYRWLSDYILIERVRYGGRNFLQIRLRLMNDKKPSSPVKYNQDGGPDCQCIVCRGVWK